MQDTFRMDAPQFSKGEIALFVDVRDNQADGIHMRGKHDLGSGTFFMDNEIAQGVDVARIGVWFRQTL